MAAVRRPQILDATARAVAKRGITGLRFADVADEAGVSIGTVQYYFRTREALLRETFAFMTEAAVDRWLDDDGDSDHWGRIVALADIVLDPSTFRERWTRWLQFWAAYARDPTLRRRMGTVYEQWREPFRRMFEAGVAAGTFNPALPLDVVVDRTIALFDGLALQVLLEAPGASVERMRAILLEALAADLGVTGQSAQKRERYVRTAARSARPRSLSSGR
jgi:AcrR family transcriptional regulator